MKNNSFFLTNRENRIYFLYKYYLFNFSKNEALDELHQQYFEYNFSKNEEKALNILIEKINLFEEILKSKLPLDWKIDRLHLIEKSILINGIFEIKQYKIKKAIIINESLNYIKKYSSIDAISLVNAILDKI